MVKVLKRVGLAWVALQLCSLGAFADEPSPEHSIPPAPPAPASTPASEPARPVVPGPQTPVDPLNTLKPAPAEPLRVPVPTGMTVPSVPVAPAATTMPQPVPPTPAAAPLTRSISGATLNAPRPVAVDPQGNVTGHDLDTLKRAPTVGAPAAAPGPLVFRTLKRLSPHEILTASSDTFAIYVLRDSERTLVLDFPNTREQSKMFARLILFIERGGASKTRVMTVPEVQKWLRDNGQAIDTMTVGNNMRTGELARFFNSARFQGEPMTVDEQKLYDWLVQSQLLREEEAGVSVVDPERILVSVPQVSSVPGCNGCTVNAAQRAVILQHELSHARFATDTVYQNYSVWFWSNALTLVQRDKFTRFLRSRGYDASIRELMANEMQAFLMHTPDPHMFSASDIGVSEGDLLEMRRRFSDGIAPKPRASADRTYQFE